MLDTVIVGGGLCGLALARLLQLQGNNFALYEARPRFGGRIYSIPAQQHGLMLDMGPTWYWPETQPRIAQLIAELGLQHFSQHDTGMVSRLSDHDKQAEQAAWPNLHGGAQRLQGGMASLIDALLAELPQDSLHLEQELVAVRDKGTHVELQFRHGDVTTLVSARQTVLALPPRLLEQHVRFQPALDEDVSAAMRATHTWMAEQAKALVAYATPFWREAGLSGNAFVDHAQVTLGEIFDACDATGSQAALGGFFDLPPDFRSSIHPVSMPMLISSQMVQVFGLQAAEGEQHVQDWALEPYTCSALDRTPPAAHPTYGNPVLRRALWQGRLMLGGSETAVVGGGYMEGALDAAVRIQRSIASHAQQQDAVSNAASLALFAHAVQSLRKDVMEHYRQSLHRYLAIQARAQITQRALLDTVDTLYQQALEQLEKLPFDRQVIGVTRGRSDLTPEVLDCFTGINHELLEEALQFNRTSCALSNFPQEHKPDDAYVDAITRDLVAAWRAFAFQVNDVLLGMRPVAVT